MTRSFIHPIVYSLETSGERKRQRERERERKREKEGDGRFSFLVGYHGSGNATDLLIFCRVCAGMQLTD